MDMIMQNRMDRGFEKYQAEYEQKALDVLRSGWYILGKEVSAFEEPDIPARSIPANSVLCARPPLIQPTSEFANSTRLLVIFVFSIISPANINRGIANMEKLSI